MFILKNIMHFIVVFGSTFKLFDDQSDKKLSRKIYATNISIIYTHIICLYVFSQNVYIRLLRKVVYERSQIVGMCG